jgi:trimethylamine--corrinoid protein Co-methyltransferase
MASGQLARRYGIPYRTSNNNTSNTVDAQAAYESQMCLWSSLLAHSNLIFAAAGWLESGLSGSFEKLIVDAEMLQMLAETLVPIDCNPSLIGMDAIAEVGPGGHFFGVGHTLERYESAFYRPLLSDRSTYETWAEGGRRDTAQRATSIWKQLLAEFESPPMDPGVDEELKAYVAKRKEAIALGARAEPAQHF